MSAEHENLNREVERLGERLRQAEEKLSNRVVYRDNFTSETRRLEERIESTGAITAAKLDGIRESINNHISEVKSDVKDVRADLQTIKAADQINQRDEKASRRTTYLAIATVVLGFVGNLMLYLVQASPGAPNP